MSALLDWIDRQRGDEWYKLPEPMRVKGIERAERHAYAEAEERRWDDKGSYATALNDQERARVLAIQSLAKALDYSHKHRNTTIAQLADLLYEDGWSWEGEGLGWYKPVPIG